VQIQKICGKMNKRPWRAVQRVAEGSQIMTKLRKLIFKIKLWLYGLN